MSWVMSVNLCGPKRPVEFFFPTASAFTFADATTWSGAQATTPTNLNAGFNLTVGCTKFRAVVLIKNMLTGANTGSALPYITLEAADNAGMTTNRSLLDIRPVYPIDGQVGVATSYLAHYTLEGSLLNTTKQFAAVFFRSPTFTNFGSIGAVTFDGWVDGTP